ncbi:tetratricopeptide repeat protein [Parachitinimonas caeni]|uniref:Tetratricopeptide repeat protein n=1 Tax=Parachitinimonas caeni TaxID=3031301 RepID=A0ABT7E3Z0_9NEIS|nr:tetratricopeptide repeat protein [Parachitinimonas caeni]MDK2127036.1 tetratricopeptide repeat protein [Parachitinimonas caeni]
MDKYDFDLSIFRVRARGFFTKGRVDDALDLYGDILKFSPDDAMTYADRGTAYAMMQMSDLALSDLNRAIELGYTDASIYCTIATIYLEMGDFSKSLECFKISLEINQKNPFAYYNRASLYEKMGDFTSAISDLRKVLIYDPDAKLKNRIEERISQLGFDKLAD